MRLLLLFISIFFVGINSFKIFAYDFKDIIQVASGKRHSCALKNSGEVFCWGDNLNYQLGSLGNDSSIPRQVPNLTNVIAISAGGQHTCALKKTGTVQCWGLNTFGQIGQGIQSNQPRIASLKEIKELKNIKSISLGENHSCALDQAGDIFCWGDNSEGQLLVNNISESSLPIKNSYIAKIAMISSGNQHICALHVRGDVFCWGDNRSGQIGNKRIQNKTVVNLVQNLKNIKSIAAGGSSTCAINNESQVYCWGDNTFSQLGIENTLENKNAKLPIPFKVDHLQDMESLSVGENHVCGLTKSGTVKCWGSNTKNNFQLGIATKSTIHYLPLEVPNLLEINSISAGGLHTCALKTNGTVYCWGNNFQGQLGNGSFSASLGRPYKVSFLNFQEKKQNQYYLSCYYYEINNSQSDSGINQTIYNNSVFSYYWGVESKSDETNYLTLNGHVEDGFFLETKISYEQAIESCNNILYLKNKSAKNLNVFKLYDIKAVLQEELQDHVYPIVFTYPLRNEMIKRIVIFGDSLSDNGNLKEFTHYLPSDPYFKGRFSNGLVWGDYFSITTQIPILNFAYGGSKSKSEINKPMYKLVSYLKSGVRNLITGGMTDYVNKYLKNYLNGNSFKGNYNIQSPEETLFVIWIGGNDYLEIMNSQTEYTKIIDNDSHKFSEGVVNNIINSVYQLQYAGAKHILVLSLPNIGMTPEAILNDNYNFSSGKFKKKEDVYYRLSEITQLHNSILKQKIEERNSKPLNSQIYYVDINPYFFKFMNNENFFDSSSFSYDLLYLNSKYPFHGFEKNNNIQLPCYKGEFKRNPITSQFSFQKNMYCIDKKDISFVRTLFWDSVHPSSYTHCLISYAIQQNLAKFQLVKNPGNTMFEYKNYCSAGFYERKIYD